MKWTIGKKLIALCSGLVVGSLLLVGVLSLFSVGRLGRSVTGLTTDRLREDGETALVRGVRQARDEVTGFVDMAERDVQKLAQSGTVSMYAEALEGMSEVWNRVTREHCETLLQGYLQAADIQNAATRKTLVSSLAVAELLMKRMGEFQPAEQTITWSARNQFSGETQEVDLPAMRVGDTRILRNFKAAKATPLVDDITQQTGAAATLFQRMNEAGDMLRIATSVIGSDGNRASGTYIPAVNPGGDANPIIAAMLRKETFIGRAFVVDQWYLTAYQPILMPDGEVGGILFVGLPEQSGALVESLVGTKIGATGYPFVMDSEGDLLVHPRADLVGKNVITDLNIQDFREALERRREGTKGWIEYPFEGRLKFISYSYFAEWDWIICASGYMDEMSANAASQALELLQVDMVQMVRGTRTATAKGEKNAYPQMRLLDETGQETVAVVNGELRPPQELQSRRGEAWFEAACRLEAGKVLVTPVEIARNTGEPEIRVCAPVFVRGALKGVAVINADWTLVWENLSGLVFGRTGYPYVINDKGVLISHPQYTLKDNHSLADARQGALSDIVRNRMLKGEEGLAQYEFEGTRVYAGFAPLELGSHRYAVAARIPEAELLEVVAAMEGTIGDEVQSLTGWMALAVLGLALIGALVAVVFSRGINNALKRIADAMGIGAGQVTSASEQVASASQSLAQGASQQASSLEESSAAMEEMASMTRQNADNAGKADALMGETKKVVGEGARAVEQVSGAIGQ
ncbi:MAG: hypothetical protein GX548_01075, partial [Lentisphaerae bacterium]|nr:hypothetical protein [Lentisphaerota bacterium]